MSDRTAPGRDADALADALLYEGSALYPYRASAPKNRWRWLFGVVQPPGSGEPSRLGCDVLVEDGGAAEIEVRLRFLQPGNGDAPLERSVAVGRFAVADLEARECSRRFSFAAAGGSPLEGEVVISGVAIAPGARRLALVLANVSAPLEPGAGRDELLRRSLVSVQLLLHLSDGRFVSLQDPPEARRAAAAACRQDGLWPILAGPRGSCARVVCAPIILEDHAAVAPESPFELGDGTEVVELLTLGLRARTDEERRESAALGEPFRSRVARAENVGAEELSRLHGAVRAFRPIVPGSRVRLRPRGGADAFDLVLTGKRATVVAVESDFDGRTHLAVVVDDDPGGDLGREGRPGHRFFFRPEEVELSSEEES